MIVRQTRRVEYKYLLPVRQVAAVRNEIQRFMQNDPYGNNYTDHAYPIYSLYFDTRNDPVAYWEKIEGLSVRQKIRIRTYAARYSKNVGLFLEYKQKQNDIIYKLRQPITIDQYETLRTNPQVLLKKKSSPFVSYITKTILTNRLIPNSHIYFNREAFIDSQNPNIRINFDYQLQSTREHALFIDSASSSVLVPNMVILEIKFWRTVPKWVQDIIRWHQLQRIPFSKYCQSIRIRDTVSGIPPN